MILVHVSAHGRCIEVFTQHPKMLLVSEGTEHVICPQPAIVPVLKLLYSAVCDGRCIMCEGLLQIRRVKASPHSRLS